MSEHEFRVIGETKAERIEKEHIDAKAKKLDETLHLARAWEREQIALMIGQYVEDCEAQADKLEDLDADANAARIAAFRVRSAIAQDIGRKVVSGWGRDPKTGEAQT